LTAGDNDRAASHVAAGVGHNRRAGARSFAAWGRVLQGRLLQRAGDAAAPSILEDGIGEADALGVAALRLVDAIT
jgi:hypothetical protein